MSVEFIGQLKRTVANPYVQGSVDPLHGKGVGMDMVEVSFTVPANASAHDVLLFAILPCDAEIYDMKAAYTDSNSVTDINIGIYDLKGNEIDDNVFADALTLASGPGTFNSSPLNFMAAVTDANKHKLLYEHAGHSLSTRLPDYALGLKVEAVGTASDIIVRIYLRKVSGG